MAKSRANRRRPLTFFQKRQIHGFKPINIGGKSRGRKPKFNRNRREEEY